MKNAQKSLRSLRLEIEGPEVDEVSDEEGDSDGNDDIDSDCY